MVTLNCLLLEYLHRLSFILVLNKLIVRTLINTLDGIEDKSMILDPKVIFGENKI